MNRPQTTAGITPETPLLGRRVEAEEATGANGLLQALRASLDTGQPSQVSEGPSVHPVDGDALCEHVAGEEELETDDPGDAQPWRKGPNTPTAAQVGAHFAAAIAGDADGALRAGARLGPRRVLTLLM
jgi:hypothetical protein